MGRIFALLALTAVIAGAFYFYINMHENEFVYESSAVSENEKLLASVSTLMALPKNEKPTIATVTNPELLDSDQFLKVAQAGDKVLIYKVAGFAILYRPLTHKILNVLQLNGNTRE